MQPNLAGVTNLTARIATGNQFASLYSSQAPPGPTTLVISPLDYIVWVGRTNVVAPVRVRVLRNGLPVVGTAVAYSLLPGSAPLLPATGTRTTDSNGDAELSFTTASLSSDGSVMACVGSGIAKRCVAVTVKAAPDAVLRIWKLAGDHAIAALGQPLPAVSFRVTDSLDPANPVRTTVRVTTIITRKPPTLPPPSDGGAQPRGEPRILSLTTTFVTTDANGRATIAPVVLKPVWGEVNVRLYCAAGDVLTTFSQFARIPTSH